MKVIKFIGLVRAVSLFLFGVFMITPFTKAIQDDKVLLFILYWSIVVNSITYGIYQLILIAKEILKVGD